jgi:hypothetical protein
MEPATTPMSAWTTTKNQIERVAASACLIAFCFGPAKLLPLAFALAAGIEGSHAVSVESGTAGDTKVVLSHQGQPRRKIFTSVREPLHPAHHHGLASQVLCLFSDSQNSQADHVALFVTGSALEDGQKKTRVPSRCLVSKSLAHATGEANTDAPHLRASSFDVCAAADRTTLIRIAAARCLRSTCLLI